MISESLLSQEIVSALISFVVSASTFIYQSKSAKKTDDLKALMEYCKNLRKIIIAFDADVKEEEFMNILFELKDDICDVKCLQKNHTEILDKIEILKFSFPEITKIEYSSEVIETNKSKLLENLKVIKNHINSVIA